MPDLFNIKKATLPSETMYEDENNNIGDNYLDIGDITTPANPSTGIRRVFVDTSTGELSVRTTGGTTVSLEQGGAGSGDDISVNGTAASDADFDDSTPAPSSDHVNVKWQKDTGTPNNISAQVQPASGSQGGIITTGTQSIAGDKTFNNAIKITQDFALLGKISPSQITANQNNYNPTGLDNAAILRLSTDASRDITGLAGGADGLEIRVYNVGSNNIVLKDEDALSTAANRFAFNGDLTLASDQSCILTYDSTSSRWRLTSSSTGGTGESNTSSNVGTGEGQLAKAKSGVNLPFKTIKQGSGVTVTNNTDDVTIAATGGGGGNILFKNTTAVEVVSTSAETNVLNLLITGGTIGTNGILRVTMKGYYLNNSGSDDQFDIRMKLGATTAIADSSGSLTSSSVRRPFTLDLLIKNMNSESSQEWAGEMLHGNDVLGDSGWSDLSTDELKGVTPIFGVSSINTASNQNLVISIDHADSHANINFHASIILVELIS